MSEENLQELKIEGRNAVLEAFRSGKPMDKVFLLDGCIDRKSTRLNSSHTS